MKVVPADVGTKINLAREIALVYIDAFPESTAYYFPRKSRARLEKLVEFGFEILLLLGAKALIVEGTHGQVAAYCLYTKPNGRRIPFRGWLKVLTRAFCAALLLSPRELGKLVASRVMFIRHVQLQDKLPKEGGRIASIAVSPKYQGKGLGSKLLAKALDELHGFPVLLEVRTDNPSAQSLYLKHGFIKHGITRDKLGQWDIMAKSVPAGAEDPAST